MNTRNASVTMKSVLRSEEERTRSGQRRAGDQGKENAQTFHCSAPSVAGRRPSLTSFWSPEPPKF